ncbi:MAG: hypothetical protein NZZ41_00800 [Candidatus Dojkabacteria bacterium]|nr:hypothetical protein [Candidatus Dojkabacteria bacterium]
MILIKYNTNNLENFYSSEYDKKIKDFFEKNIHEKKSIKENFLYDYKDQKRNFFYLIENKIVPFIYILENENGEIIHVSLMRRLDIEKNIFSLCNRAVTKKELKGKGIMMDYILPIQIDDCKNLGAKMCIATFNENYKLYIELLKRCKENKGFALGKLRNKKFLKNFNFVEFPCNIFNTKQWVIYMKLDQNYEFDFEKIKF